MFYNYCHHRFRSEANYSIAGADACPLGDIDFRHPDISSHEETPEETRSSRTQPTNRLGLLTRCFDHHQFVLYLTCA